MGGRVDMRVLMPKRKDASWHDAVAAHFQQERRGGNLQCHAAILPQGSTLSGMKALGLALVAALSAGQAARPVTLVSEVRAAIAAHDQVAAERLLASPRPEPRDAPAIIQT